LEAEKIIHSRDIVWLNRSVAKRFSSQSISKDESGYEDNEDFIESIKKLDHECSANVIDESKRKEIASNKVYQQRKILESSFNPEASKLINDIEQGRDIFLDQMNVSMLSLTSVFQEESKTFDEAWNHKDSVMREKWREAIDKELEEMKKKQVWEDIKKEIFPRIGEL